MAGIRERNQDNAVFTITAGSSFLKAPASQEFPEGSLVAGFSPPCSAPWLLVGSNQPAVLNTPNVAASAVIKEYIKSKYPKKCPIGARIVTRGCNWLLADRGKSVASPINAVTTAKNCTMMKWTKAADMPTYTLLHFLFGRFLRSR